MYPERLPATLHRPHITDTQTVRGDAQSEGGLMAAFEMLWEQLARLKDVADHFSRRK